MYMRSTRLKRVNGAWTRPAEAAVPAEPERPLAQIDYDAEEFENFTPTLFDDLFPMYPLTLDMEQPTAADIIGTLAEPYEYVVPEVEDRTFDVRNVFNDKDEQDILRILEEMDTNPVLELPFLEEEEEEEKEEEPANKRQRLIPKEDLPEAEDLVHFREVVFNALMLVPRAIYNWAH